MDPKSSCQIRRPLRPSNSAMAPPALAATTEGPGPSAGAEVTSGNAAIPSTLPGDTSVADHRVAPDSVRASTSSPEP